MEVMLDGEIVDSNIINNEIHEFIGIFIPIGRKIEKNSQIPQYRTKKTYPSTSYSLTDFEDLKGLEYITE